jgi:hypothetical protein
MARFATPTTYVPVIHSFYCANAVGYGLVKWPTQESGTTFYYQSATLYITYYYVQIQAHRPFIPAIGETSPLSLPSLVICANAARSCSHILASLLPHDGVVIQPFLAVSLFGLRRSSPLQLGCSQPASHLASFCYCTFGLARKMASRLI